MASSLSLIILIPIVAYFCYLQYKIMKLSENKHDKMYVSFFLIIFIICAFLFFVNVDIRSPLDIIFIIVYGVFFLFFWGFHFVYKRILGKEGMFMKPVDQKFQEDKSGLHEFMRKFFHFFVFGGSLLFITLWCLIAIETFKTYPDFGAYGRNPVWEDSFLAPLNVDFEMKPLFWEVPPLQGAMLIFFMVAMPFAIILLLETSLKLLTCYYTT